MAVVVTAGPSTKFPHGVLLFDGDCGFCTTSAGWAERIAGDVAVIAYQFVDLSQWHITEQAANEELHYVDGHGRVSRGSNAVGRFLIDAGFPWSLPGRVIMAPGVRRIAAWVYRLVSENRSKLPGGTPACKIQRP